MNQQDLKQAKAMFRFQLDEERDKGLADGAKMFLDRFTQTHGVSPVQAVNNLHAAAEQVALGLEWGEAACAYIAELEENNRELRRTLDVCIEELDFYGPGRQ